MGGLARAMLRRHLASYAGVAATVVLGSALLGASTAGLVSAASGDGLPRGSTGTLAPGAPDLGLGDEMSIATASLLGMTLGIVAMVTIFMIASAVTFAVGSRRRELALLRLAGAKPRQVSRTIVAEMALLGLAGSTVGALLAVPAATGAVAALQRIGFAPAELVVTPRWWVSAVTVAAGTLTTVCGARAPARRAGRVAPLEAVVDSGTPRRSMTAARWVTGVGGLVAAAVLLRVPVTDVDSGLMSVIGMSYLLVIALSALGPLVVPALATAVGTPLALAWPGVGTLARAQAGWAANRTAALAAPVLLMVGLVGSLLVLTETAPGLNAEQRQRAVLADVVVVPGPDGLDRDALAAAVATSAGVESWAATREAGWRLAADQPGSDAADVTLTVVAVEPADLPGLVAIETVDGDWAEVGGPAVAVSSRAAARHGLVPGSPLPAAPGGSAGAGAPGDTGDVPASGTGSSGDHPVGLRVTATVESTAIWADAFVDPATFVALTGDDGVDLAYLAVAPGANPVAVVAALDAALPGTEVMTTPDWIARSSTTEAAVNRQVVLVMCGAAVLLALFGCAQTVVSSARGRREEFTLLRASGATPGQVVGAVVAETLVVVATAAAMLTVVLGYAVARTGQVLDAIGSAVPAVLPAGMLLAGLGGCLVAAVLAAVGGTLWSLRGAAAS